MALLETLLGLTAASVALALLARALRLPSAVTLVLGGMALAFVPGLPEVELAPDLALALFLPPLLQASALRTDWPDFRANLPLILLLAVGAVLVTAGAVAATVKPLAPELPWAAAIALGAIVAPPDAVSATSVLKGFRLPKRIVTVLEGESLINDASSLVLYRFAVAATMAGAVSLAEASVSFLVSAAGGAAIGVAVGWATVWLLLRLQDRMLEIVVSFLSAFASYFAAEAVHVSGVLAAVACGGVVGRRRLELAAGTRLEANTAWEFVEFVLTSLVFTLMGLQLRGILERLTDTDPWRLALLAAAASTALIVSRIAWVFATFYPVSALMNGLRGQGFAPPLSYPAIISWAGMRGVVSLAAALALPAEFPSRDEVVFVVFCCILTSLLLQGTTLAPLIRRFDLSDPEIEAVRPEVATARKEVAAAAVGALSDKLEDREHAEVAETLVRDFRARVEHAERLDEDPEAAQRRLNAQLRLRLSALGAARAKLAELRDELDGETLATLVEELDLEEEQVRVALRAAEPT
ncbi:Na+/H+ antiporter [Belnapia sp. T6]|uniref:Na+/H+ antiporter n=1 Tax=Belnapia mucosa TaxID=2804532 RepID=A0ABS1VCH6_9PROT|nr:Na+/H+ antiporter [Belnapia mucosa]MBL6459386.1 Na+/H+ antiporter [Belnapia mucosa]